MGFSVKRFGFRVQGLRLGIGSRVWGFGCLWAFRFEGDGFRIQGCEGFWALGFRMPWTMEIMGSQ